MRCNRSFTYTHFIGWVGGSSSLKGGKSNPHYGPNSLESIDMRTSLGAVQMRHVLDTVKWRGTTKINGVGSRNAFINTIFQPLNGIQAQLGGFNWTAKRTGNKMHMMIDNKVDYNSFVYHMPDGLNWINGLFGHEPQLATGWDQGCMSTTHQLIDWWEDVPAEYRK
jgi:hypothetical protein